MNGKIYQGKRVELVPLDPGRDSAAWASWNHDSEYLRYLDDGPASQYSASMIKEWFEEGAWGGTLFMVRTLKDQQMIGFVELGGYDWVSRNAWVGIGIGDKEFRSQGYGTETMQLVLEFAFRVQNLHRVNLGVFEFNERAKRCYEKCGFRYEGSEREGLLKDDQRWSSWNMGILRSEWQAMQSVSE